MDEVAAQRVGCLQLLRQRIPLSWGLPYAASSEVRDAARHLLCIALRREEGLEDHRTVEDQGVGVGKYRALVALMHPADVPVFFLGYVEGPLPEADGVPNAAQ